MDKRRFDSIAKALASGASRRRVLKGMAGSAAGGVLGIFGKNRAFAQGDEEVTGGAGGAGGAGGTGANVSASVGNGGTATSTATGGNISIGDTSSGDISVGVSVGDTTAGAATGGDVCSCCYTDYNPCWCECCGVCDDGGDGGDAFGGDASVGISVGDISSSVSVTASADANASASADGGDNNVVDIDLTDVEGGAGGAGGDGGDATDVDIIVVS